MTQHLTHPNHPSQTLMRQSLQAYVDLTNVGDAAGLVALFAQDAVIEDPVGSALKKADELAAWFGDSVAFGAKITPVAPIRGSHSNSAALVFDVEFTPPGQQRLRIRSVDICTFDQAGKITSLRAYWGPEDVEPAA